MERGKELLKYALAFIFICSLSIVYAFGQTDYVNDTSLPSRGHWYNQGWVWVVGILIVILFVAGMARKKKS